MLTFLRKIRKSLIKSQPAGASAKQGGSTRKYILYAIGEIALVVMGILIALQINNWNEERKTKIFEKEILKDINIGLALNIWQLENAVKSCNRAANSCKIVLDFLNDEMNYHDSLSIHFSRTIRWFRPTVTNAGYESLKSYGRHLVKNDSIRHQLEIFDVEWIHVLHERQEQFFNVTVSPILTKHFTVTNFSQSIHIEPGNQMKPFDVMELKRSREYYNIINTLRLNREGQAWWYNNWLENMKKISVMIEKELDQFKKS